jgi:lysyl-tRNA synthetase class 2
LKIWSRKGVELFPNDYQVPHSVRDIQTAIEKGEIDVDGKTPVFCVAGRIMAINRFGKTAFVRFRDRTGQLQAYIRKDQVGEQNYEVFQQLDVGDFIGVQGSVFQTKTGEWTLLVQDCKLISKSFRPLPEKFHGLKYPEKRYRQRYIDLIMNPDGTFTIFTKRSKIIQMVRTFLLDKGFYGGGNPHDADHSGQVPKQPPSRPSQCPGDGSFFKDCPRTISQAPGGRRF